MADLVDGGWEGIMQHNHELAIQGRNILCEQLNIQPPCPDEMIACISTIKVTETQSTTSPLGEILPKRRDA